MKKLVILLFIIILIYGINGCKKTPRAVNSSLYSNEVINDLTNTSSSGNNNILNKSSNIVKKMVVPPAKISDIFIDPEFADLVASLLNKDVYDIVTKEDLANYKGELNVSVRFSDDNDLEYKDLAGIGYLTDVTMLRCSKNGVTEIPLEIKNLKNLEVLDFLKSFALKTIPKEIGELNKLKIFSVSLTEVDFIPDEITNCTNLEVLRIDNNNISKIPNNIGNLSKLRVLEVLSTNITEIPESICNLTNLKEVSLSNTKITSLPTNFGNLKSLETLLLFNCNLKQLPKSMENLKFLSNYNAYNNFTLNESYKSFIPKYTKNKAEIALGNDFTIDYSSINDGSELEFYYEKADIYGEKYYSYKEFIPKENKNGKITLDKILFDEATTYKIIIISKTSSKSPIYKSFLTELTVK